MLYNSFVQSTDEGLGGKKEDKPEKTIKHQKSSHAIRKHSEETLEVWILGIPQSATAGVCGSFRAAMVRELLELGPSQEVWILELGPSLEVWILGIPLSYCRRLWQLQNCHGSLSIRIPKIPTSLPLLSH